MSEVKQTLNKAQQKAVFHETGPMLIIAGAGTGKTSVITERIAHLILDKNVNADAVLALTFTEKAAAEMEERADKALPYGYVDLWISTFHSFCEKILRQHGLEIGLPTDFTLLTQTEQWLLVRQNLEKFPLDYYRPRGNPTKFIHALLGHFSRAKDEDTDAQSYADYADGNYIEGEKSDDPVVVEEAMKQKEAAGAYQIYQQLLLDNSCLDFGDLVMYTLELLRTRPGILQKLRDQFEYILVDEFQDTNFAQYELIKLLAGEKANLTVVGDDDQAIYKFRGASISNILQFKKDYPKSKEVVLTENYRSGQPILDLSYQFIQLNNPNRLEVTLPGKGKKKLSKKLKALPGKTGTIKHLHFNTLEDEVAGVIDEIIKIKKADPELAWSDFAILVRANDSAINFTNFLRKTGIPHQFVALKGLYGKPIILDVLSYMKLLDNYHEGPAMFRVLSSPMVSMNHEDLMNIAAFANRKSISLYQAIRRITEIEPLKDQNTVSKIRKLLSLIDGHTKLVSQKTVGQVYVSFIQLSGILEQLLKDETPEDRQNLEYLQSFHQRIQKFETSMPDPSLKNFMEEMDLELESGERGSLQKDQDYDPDTLMIMTMHGAKGLEFEHVFIPNMVDKKFPSMERSDPIELPAALIKEELPSGDFHLEEERRLFYVAMTRAKSGLYLSSADDYGGLRKKKISRFLAELAQTSPNFKLSESVLVEKEFVRSKIEISKSIDVFRPPLPAKFSFSQIASFQKCPYQYKLGFIYRIPIFGKPVFSYGKTMHSTMENFYLLLAERSAAVDKVKQPQLFDDNALGNKTIGQIVSLDDLMNIFDKEWIDEWYDSASQQEEYKAKGKSGLVFFYDSVKDHTPRVKFLEKPFNLKLTSGNETYTLRGVIDRVDVLPNGEWQIIDYKTGSAKDSLEWQDKMQLLIYQVAAQELFNVKVNKLTYYYLDEGKELSFVGQDKDILRLKNELLEMISQLKVTDFKATPGWQCQFCDFRDICEFK